jgi:hypothetical protein
MKNDYRFFSGVIQSEFKSTSFHFVSVPGERLNGLYLKG